MAVETTFWDGTAGPNALRSELTFHGRATPATSEPDDLEAAYEAALDDALGEAQGFRGRIAGEPRFHITVTVAATYDEPTATEGGPR